MNDTDPPWQLPPIHPALETGRVHVWRSALDQPPPDVRRLAELLSDAELARAARFHFERHRRRYIVSQGHLRQILGRYLALEPAQIAFEQGERGKPRLAPQSGSSGLAFNVAHSHEMALYAVAPGARVGVDLEYVRPVTDLAQIVERYFAGPEREAFRAVPAGQQLAAFFNGWTRKEAYLKAIGQGLYHPLDGFAVSLAPGEPARLLAIEGDASRARGWSLHALNPGPGYIAALAVEGEGWGLDRFHTP